MSTRRAPIILVFIAGSLVGGVSAQLAAPLVHAEGSTPAVQRWEHYCEQYTANGAKIAGERGWEMVGIYAQQSTSSETGSIVAGRVQTAANYYSLTSACYKRPLSANAPATTPPPAAPPTAAPAAKP